MSEPEPPKHHNAGVLAPVEDEDETEDEKMAVRCSDPSIEHDASCGKQILWRTRSFECCS